MLSPLLLAVSLVATARGFEAPESVFWDEVSRTWFVSNVVGKENEKDGKGWISRLDAKTGRSSNGNGSTVSILPTASAFTPGRSTPPTSTGWS